MMGVDREEQTTDSSFTPRIGRSVSLDHAAELLGISRRTLYNRIRDGYLQTVRANNSQRVLVDSIGEHLRRERELMQKRALIARKLS